MPSELGIARHRLDEIELRLLGADHRPWVLNRSEMRDENGRFLICKGSRKAAKKAIGGSLVWMGDRYEDREQKDYAATKDAIAGLDPLKNRPRDLATHVDPAVLRKHLALFKLCDQATDDMAEFVAHAPEDMEELVNGVKFLQMRLEKAENEREDFKKEMLALRVDNAALQSKLAEMRNAWKAINKAFGS